LNQTDCHESCSLRQPMLPAASPLWFRPGPLAIFPQLSEYGIARQFPPTLLLRSQKPEGPKAIPRCLLSTEVIFSSEPVAPQPGESIALSRLRLCGGFDPTVLLRYFRFRWFVLILRFMTSRFSEKNRGYIWPMKFQVMPIHWL
jgi:hypothetical protein